MIMDSLESPEYQENLESSKLLSLVETILFTMTNDYIQSIVLILTNEEVLLIQFFVINKFLH